MLVTRQLWKGNSLSAGKQQCNLSSVIQCCLFSRLNLKYQHSKMNFFTTWHSMLCFVCFLLFLCCSVLNLISNMQGNQKRRQAVNLLSNLGIKPFSFFKSCDLPSHIEDGNCSYLQETHVLTGRPWAAQHRHLQLSACEI